MARRMVDMVQEWVGHLTGGLLMAEVLATYLFSGVSGSKAADVATIGTVMKGPMKKHGYPSTEFVAVLAASAAMAETVPPSVAMLILGSVTTLSVGALFIAGFLPAAMLAVTLLIGVVIRSHVKKYRKGPPFNLRPGVAQHSARVAGGRRADPGDRRPRRRHRVADRVGVVRRRLRLRRRRIHLPLARLAQLLRRAARRDAHRRHGAAHGRRRRTCWCRRS